MPGNDGKGIQIGIEILVGFVDADESLDGRAVKHDLVVDRTLDLGGGDGDVFQLSENIGELQADKFHVLLFHDPNNVFFGITHNHCILSFRIFAQPDLIVYIAHKYVQMQVQYITKCRFVK